MPNLADTPEPIKQCPDMVGLRSCRGIPQPGEWRRGRCGRRERDERQDHPQTVPTELDPVDYRLEQSPVRHRLAGIGQQALPQVLCFSHDMGISADGGPVR